MNYIDEEIIKLRRRKEQEKFCNLDTGMYVDNQFIEFEKTYMEEVDISISLPQTFVTMPESMTKIKYPAETRPQIIKTSLDTGVNFTFSSIDMQLKGEQLSMAAKQMKQIIQKLNPANLFYEEKPDTTDCGNAVSWFDYLSHAIDEQVYNLMYLLPLTENMVLHGCFNCKHDLKEEWKPIVLLVMKSIVNGDKIGGTQNESTKH